MSNRSFGKEVIFPRAGGVFYVRTQSGQLYPTRSVTAYRSPFGETERIKVFMVPDFRKGDRRNRDSTYEHTD